VSQPEQNMLSEKDTLNIDRPGILLPLTMLMNH